MVLAGRRVPQPDGLVVSATGQSGAIVVERQMIDVVAMALEPRAARRRCRVKQHDLAKRAGRASADGHDRAVRAPRDGAHEIGQARQRRDASATRHRQAMHLLVAGDRQLQAVGPPRQRRDLRQHRRVLRQRRHLLVDRRTRGLRVRRAGRHPGAQHGDLVGLQVLLRRHLRLGAALDLQNQRALVGLARHQRRARVAAAHQVLMAFEQQPAFDLRGVVTAQAVALENRHDVAREIGWRWRRRRAAAPRRRPPDRGLRPAR